MRVSSALALAWAAAVEAYVQQGFNYGATHTDGSAVSQDEYEALFNKAKNLPGTSGFTSARLYTMIQTGTQNTPIAAIPAAINTQTGLLLGLWASAGQSHINDELAALTSAIQQYGSSFTQLIQGISVGSEDLYRVSPTGILNKSGYGASPDEIVAYINQTRNAIAGTSAKGAPIGHVDTWTAWVNGSNSAVNDAVDWLGVDTYPYFQNTESNSIENGASLFWAAIDATKSHANGKDVWVTETGWPVSGPTENLAVASTQNAETYWQDVACSLIGKVNTYWYTLQDAFPTTPSPSFGIIGSDLSGNPVYDLTCKAQTSSSSAAASSSTSASSATAAGSGATATSTGSSSSSGSSSTGSSASSSASGSSSSGTSSSSGSSSSGSASSGSSSSSSSGSSSAGSSAAAGSGSSTAASSAYPSSSGTSSGSSSGSSSSSGSGSSSSPISSVTPSTGAAASTFGAASFFSAAIALVAVAALF